MINNFEDVAKTTEKAQKRFTGIDWSNYDKREQAKYKKVMCMITEVQSYLIVDSAISKAKNGEMK